MSLTDESNVPHRPPQVGDRVEVRLAGKVVELRDGLALVVVGHDQLEEGEDVSVWQAADRIAILRDLAQYQPALDARQTRQLGSPAEH